MSAPFGVFDEEVFTPRVAVEIDRDKLVQALREVHYPIEVQITDEYKGIHWRWFDRQQVEHLADELYRRLTRPASKS